MAGIKRRLTGKLRAAASRNSKEKNYWLNRFAGEPVKCSFPYDHKTGRHGRKADTIGFELSPGYVSHLLKQIKCSDQVLHIYLAAGLFLLLEKYTSAKDITIGTPIYKQESNNNSPGEFINTVLPLRCQPKDEMTFKELLVQVKQAIVAAIEHQNYPVELLAEHLDSSYNEEDDFPLFDAAILLENIHDKEYLHHLHVNMIFSFSGTGEGIKAEVRYNSLLYDESTIERLTGHFNQLLQTALADTDASLSGISIVPEEEKKQLLFDFNCPGDEFPAEKTIHGLLAEQVKKTPGSVSLVGETGDIQLSYTKLDEITTGLAGALRERGVKPGVIAGIMTERSLEMIFAIIAVLKAGGAYLPINPKNPGTRKKYIINDSNIHLLLTHRGLGEKLAHECKILNLEDEQLYQGYADKEEAGERAVTGTFSDLAYVIYTSGSTGNPKGVPITHFNFSPLLHWGYKYLGIGPADRVIQNLSYFFDWAVWEIFIALTTGAGLHMISDDILLNPGEQVDFINRKRITVLHITPTQYQYLVNVGSSMETLKRLFIGAEKLPVDLVQRTIELLDGQCKIYNMYGPTEATIISAVLEIPGAGQKYEELSSIPIGKTIGNTDLLVADKHMQLCPINVEGELYIAGDALAHGYLNDPVKTSKAFVRNVFKDIPGDRLYKTGDRVRWLADGMIEFFGRVDHQVKVRGYRIEPGEIENQLLKHTGIKEAVVITREDKQGEKYLCAYLVPALAGRSLSLTHLREFLAPNLPDYMIPSYFVTVERMPLNPNGKVDIKALPEPNLRDSKENYVAPGDSVEHRLAEIWSQVLGIGKDIIGIEDNFFQLGGHSLKVTELVHRVYKEFAIEIEIADVFVHPTIKEMGQQIKAAETSEYTDIIPAEKKEYYELSHGQRRLWVLCQFEKDSIAYNMPGAFMISGAFDVGNFIQAVQILVDGHESLRTRFILVDGEPRQKIIKDLKFTMPQIDLSGLNNEEKEKKSREIFEADTNTPFNLEQCPLFRFKSVRWEDEKYLIIYNIHHIINDAWSHEIIHNEIFTAYNSLLTNRENPGVPLRLHYKDYTQWHNRQVDTGSYQQARGYWLEKFQDKPNGIGLPLDHARKPVQTFNGGRVLFALDKEKTGQLRILGAHLDATLFMSLLTLMDIFLYRYSGQEDIIIGSPIANRKHPELQHMIGFLVNTLVYRTPVNPGESFNDLLAKVKQEALTCYQHQDYPFDLLVEKLELERVLSQSPLFNVMLTHNNPGTAGIEQSMAGVTITGYSHGSDFNMSKFDMIFFMNEINDQLHIQLEYNSDLFERRTIQRMADNFSTLVDNALADPDVSIAKLNIISREEMEMILYRFNATDLPLSGLTLQELFENRVEKSAHKIAVQDRDKQITYNELNKETNRLALYLREEYRIQANDIIGISVERSIEMIVALAGTIKSGAAYLAIDPTYPGNRVLYMLKDSKASLLIVDKAARQLLREIFQDYPGNVIDMNADRAKITGQSVGNPPIVNQMADTLYVTYTSGSTGIPNGAAVTHEILTNLIRWQEEKTTIDGSMRCLQFASVNFDVSFQEIMSTFTSGGTLFLIGDTERKDIDYLLDFLSIHCIEILYLPFYYLNFLFTETRRWAESFRHSLKHLVTAGEQLIITPGLKEFLDSNPGVQLHNHYGPAEMHVVTSYTMDASVVGGRLLPPIGRPIANVKMLIGDQQDNPVPIGVWGELHIMGPAEFAGYINKPALTEKKLFRHQVPGWDKKRLYRTGDIGRWLEDGNIELRGRKDFQVKIRGFRVEPGEIESKLLSIKNIKKCVVVVKENKDHQNFLAAYIVVDQIDVSEIKKIIGKHLPRYMIPGFVVLDSLPLLPNGKVDRDKLPEPIIEEAEERALPRNETDEKLVQIWRGLLDIETIGINDDFFEIGGHSLLVQKLINAINSVFQVKLSFQDVFQSPTISSLSDLIGQSEIQSQVRIEKLPESDYYELSYSQGRLWILYKMDPRNPAFNIAGRVTLYEKVDKVVIEQVFERLIRRHESFRTYFKEIDNRPVQVICPRRRLNLEMIDLLDLPGEERANSRQKCFRDESVVPFDLGTAPLMRAKLIKCKEDEFDLILNIHHIIFDGWSMEILEKEFHLIYESVKKGDTNEPGLEPLGIQYKDFAAWNNRLLADENKMQAAKTFWKNQLSGDNGNSPSPLALPYDSPGKEDENKESAGYRLVISGEITNRLRTIARQGNASLFMVLLAGFNLFLSRVSSQKDIILAVPGAARQHEDLKNIIGFFVNTLILRSRIDPHEAFPHFLARVQENVSGVLEYQSYPLELICKELKIRYPEISVFFNMLTFGHGDREYLEDFEPGHINVVQDAKFDMVFYLSEFKNAIEINTHYYKRLFRAENIEKLMRLYAKILEKISLHPGKQVGEYIRPGRKLKIKRA